MDTVGVELKSGDSIPYLGRHLKVVKNGEAVDSVKLEWDRLLVN